MKKIWAHTIVKNEENFVWYSVMSVINHVDKMLIYDTGSKDKTVSILKEIKKVYSNKVDFSEVGDVNAREYRELRQKMLDKSLCDWIFILDGDEIWWEDSIKKLISTINLRGDNLNSIVTPYFNLVGDIYHYQDEKAGKYKIGSLIGNYNIRAINRNISGLYLEGDYPLERYCDKNGVSVQDMPDEKIGYQKEKYIHITFLSRSSIENDPRRANRRKVKHELGNSFPLDFYYPEVFFRPKPKLVPSPWKKMDRGFFIRSFLESSLKKLKRKII